MITYKSKKKSAQSPLVAGKGINSDTSSATLDSFTSWNTIKSGSIINCQGYTSLKCYSQYASYSGTIFVMQKDGTIRSYNVTSTEITIPLSTNDSYIICTVSWLQVKLQ